MRRAQSMVGIELEGEAKTVANFSRMAELITECAKMIQWIVNSTTGA